MQEDLADLQVQCNTLKIEIHLKLPLPMYRNTQKKNPENFKLTKTLKNSTTFSLIIVVKFDKKYDFFLLNSIRKTERFALSEINGCCKESTLFLLPEICMPCLAEQLKFDFPTSIFSQYFKHKNIESLTT